MSQRRDSTSSREGRKPTLTSQLHTISAKLNRVLINREQGEDNVDRESLASTVVERPGESPAVFQSINQRTWWLESKFKEAKIRTISNIILICSFDVITFYASYLFPSPLMARFSIPVTGTNMEFLHYPR
jgi:hypothetical protein